MTYNLSPQLFVENGAAIASMAVHRRHELLRFRFAEVASRPAELPAAANLDEPAPGTIRFAL